VWGTLPAITAYGLLAAWLLSFLIVDPTRTYLSQGVQDQQAFEWYFGATAHNLVTFSNPLFSTLQNHPTGVNMMANATVMGLGVPLAPVTLLVGPQWTFLIVEWLGFTATATCWYALFARRLTVHRLAAFVGGLLVGFSPAMVSHANGHPNFLAQFLVPVIIDRLLDLGEPHARAAQLRKGLLLGVLVTWQLWMGEEVLLLASLGIGLAALAMLVQGRLPWRTMLPGVLIGAATSITLFAYPLWWQFAGPQSYTSMWQGVANNDLAALWERATRSVGSDPSISVVLSLNRTEENAFFGMPIWALLLVVLLLAWRRPVVRAAVLVIVASVWTSLGTAVTLHGAPTSIPAIWPRLADLPLFESLLPTRFTLITVPAIATLLVVALDWAIGQAVNRPVERSRPVARALQSWGILATTVVAVLVALTPMIPTPLWAEARPAVPAFFTQGQWRVFVDDGSVLAVPPPDICDMRAADWQAAAAWDFPLVEGYFMGPDGSGTGMGIRGAVRRPFSQWLATINQTQVARTATAEEKAQFIRDLSAWRTDLVVLDARTDVVAQRCSGAAGTTVLRRSVESVLGPATESGGVAFWDVRRWRDG